MCCHGSSYLFRAAGARSCCQVERGWAERVSGVWGWRGGRVGSRRPLAVLAIGSENRRNVGQLCHPFEVGTACLWSGGRVLGFHVLLLGDLGRPELHKLYWLYCLEKKKGKKRRKKKLARYFPSTRKTGALWTQEKRVLWVSRPVFDTTCKQTKRGKCIQVSIMSFTWAVGEGVRWVAV